MAKFNRWEFRVTGGGHFPVDMLRYDACWPKSQDDVASMDQAPESRHVDIRGTQQPSEARWSSFGWEVSDIRGYKV